MHYINLRFTYLLHYLLIQQKHTKICVINNKTFISHHKTGTTSIIKFSDT